MAKYDENDRFPYLLALQADENSKLLFFQINSAKDEENYNSAPDINAVLNSLEQTLPKDNSEFLACIADIKNDALPRFSQLHFYTYDEKSDELEPTKYSVFSWREAQKDTIDSALSDKNSADLTYKLSGVSDESVSIDIGFKHKEKLYTQTITIENLDKNNNDFLNLDNFQDTVATLNKLLSDEIVLKSVSKVPNKTLEFEDFKLTYSTQDEKGEKIGEYGNLGLQYNALRNVENFLEDKIIERELKLGTPLGLGYKEAIDTALNKNDANRDLHELLCYLQGANIEVSDREIWRELQREFSTFEEIGFDKIYPILVLEKIKELSSDVLYQTEIYDNIDKVYANLNSESMFLELEGSKPDGVEYSEKVTSKETLVSALVDIAQFANEADFKIIDDFLKEKEGKGVMEIKQEQSLKVSQNEDNSLKI